MSYEERRVAVRQSAIRFHDVRCDGCNRPLESAFSTVDVDGWERLDPRDAVKVTVSGGYGSTWDEYSHTFLVCEDCLPRLHDTFPSIGADMECERRP